MMIATEDEQPKRVAPAANIESSCRVGETHHESHAVAEPSGALASFILAVAC